MASEYRRRATVPAGQGTIPPSQLQRNRLQHVREPSEHSRLPSRNRPKQGVNYILYLIASFIIILIAILAVCRYQWLSASTLQTEKTTQTTGPLPTPTLMPNMKDWFDNLNAGNEHLAGLPERIRPKMPDVTAEPILDTSERLETQIADSLGPARSSVRRLMLELSEAPTAKHMFTPRGQQDEGLRKHFQRLRAWWSARYGRPLSQLKSRIVSLNGTFGTLLNDQHWHIELMTDLESDLFRVAIDPICDVATKSREEYNKMLLTEGRLETDGYTDPNTKPNMSDHVVTSLGKAADILDTLCITVGHNRNKLAARMALMRQEIEYLEGGMEKLEGLLDELDEGQPMLTETVVTRVEEAMSDLAQQWYDLVEGYFNND
ncbi:hypothetical protein EDB81DRAFT_874659 [Dactylonectria macrodidyma]|uniref:Uncharacterized protein n=1 Tax=Dactylonectria macrodidyma TaxID=307937 RepID=A0A9P9FSG3_9HYPO|nr:hypothetical protein EDB81DRAFT_874659 [Dactylonectria macrodidyma]